MRLLSLVPAATEWICSFGAETDLVGRSHACDYPPSVTSLPEVTSARALTGSSGDIDRQVHDSLMKGEALYVLDTKLIRELHPDLIIAQDQCGVCALPVSELDALLGTWAGKPPTVLTVSPSTLKQILDTALRIGQAIGRMEAAMQWLAQAEGRLQQLRNRLGLHRRMPEAALPSIVCIEWMDPVMTAGHWMPDVISMAGGRPLLAEKGARSEYVAWDAILQANPDVLLIAPCGFTIEQTRRELHTLTTRAGWYDLKAVCTGRVYLLDGNAYFNRPGPRIYRSIEIIATALYLYGGVARPSGIEEWELQPITRTTHPSGSGASLSKPA